uniref:Uncharacterized protein n=1 Tax=Arundo donax TaxID=35708 RepID=A0A0A9A2T1_ARUDO
MRQITLRFQLFCQIIMVGRQISSKYGMMSSQVCRAPTIFKIQWYRG